MLIILSGTRQEAADWAARNNVAYVHYRCVMDYTEMMGLRPENHELELVGTWNNNERTMETINYLLKSDWRHMLKRKLNER